VILCDLLSVVQPVDFLDVFVHLLTESDRLDVKIGKALVLWVHDEVLSLGGHELGEEPSAEKLSIEGLPPLVVIVLVGVLELDDACVGLDACHIEELLIYLLISVGMRPTELVGLPN